MDNPVISWAVDFQWVQMIFWLCLRKFCGEADRVRLAGQRQEFKTYWKSTAQFITNPQCTVGLQLNQEDSLSCYLIKAVEMKGHRGVGQSVSDECHIIFHETGFTFNITVHRKNNWKKYNLKWTPKKHHFSIFFQVFSLWNPFFFCRKRKMLQFSDCLVIVVEWRKN